jgi:hypothetical protein
VPYQSSIRFRLIALDALDAALKFAPGQHHAAFAAQAAHTDIRAHTVHLPAITAAGVCFAHLNYISNPDVERHSSIIPQKR